MLKHQLLDILRTFTNHEKKRFGKFLNSAYFNKSPKITKLYWILRKYHPEYNNKKITKMFIWKKLDYGLAFNDSTIRNLIYDLQIIAETFLRIKANEFNLVESNALQRGEFIKRELDVIYQINIDNSNLQMAKNKHFNSQHLMDRFRLNSDQFYFNLAQNTLDNGNYGKNADMLRSGIVNLINYFVVEFVKHNETLYSSAQKFNAKQKQQFVSEFLKIIDADKLTEYLKKHSEGGFTAEVYLKLLKTFMNFSNERFYKDMLNTLNKYSKRLTVEENKYLYGRLADYNRIKASTTKNPAKYESELMKIYEIMLNNAIYPAHYKGEIRLDAYKEIQDIAIRLKKLSWLQEFIANYKNKIHPVYRRDINLYSLAVLNYEKGKYKEAYDQLSKIELDGFMYELEARGLMIKLAYHSGNLEMTQNMIDGYNNYLFRHRKLPEKEKAAHEGYADYMQLLLNYKNGDDKYDINVIKKKIVNNSYLLYKDWMMGKAITLSRR